MTELGDQLNKDELALRVMPWTWICLSIQAEGGLIPIRNNDASPIRTTGTICH